MKKIKLCILGNENVGSTKLWEQACAKREDLSWAVINFCAANWMKKIELGKYDLYLTKPGGLTQRFKQLYDERLQILCQELGAKAFPSLKEVLIYENKRYLSFWLQANSIAHPKTWVFYDKREALDFCAGANYPLVGKSNIGASGRGVLILKDAAAASRYIKRHFSTSGALSRWYPDLKKGKIIPRVQRMLQNKAYRQQKTRAYAAIRKDPQRGFVFLQEYIEHSFEWRVVRMGDSFFAHKKLQKKGKASGTLLKGYENPPLELFDFVKNITDNHALFSQSVDIFESSRGYLVNEMQCFFGQSDPHQMFVDGIPGRYLNKGGNWLFEAGDFNTNESYDLRLDTAIRLYRGGRLQ